ncbi:MAG: ABC transporter permease [Bacteroidales bacterium]|nr:ABC transporter permease [Bacteroidales bacterium]
MVEHYFKVTFRHIRKHLLISILNIAGLAIGIASFVLIMLYVNHELNYDRYNEHFDDIYRVAVDAKIGNTVIRQTWTPAPMPAAMYDEYPEVRAITRIADRSMKVTLGDLVYNEDRAAAVDSTFTEIFTLKFLEGAPGKVLNEPGQVLLDRSTARKYFGEETAYGKVIMIRDTVPLTVMGVYEDFPSQSHFHFNILVSLLSMGDGYYNGQQWFANNFETYMRLKPGFPETQLEAKLPAFVDKYLFEGTYEERADDENYWKLYLQHIREIHLGSDLNGEFEPNGNLSYIRIFSIVALLLLVVACINFMNLTTASSSIRAREVGVRKTNGASRKKLRQQFFSEAIIISLLALILAMGLVESIMGPYRNFTGREIEVEYLDNFLVIPGLLALAIIVGLLSGIYPALYMSNFSAIDSLGFKGVKQSKSWFRNILVLFQFSVATFLIAATLLVQRQMNLIMENSLGFNKEQVVLVKNASYLENLDTYKDELRTLPEVIQVSASAWVPGDKITNWGFGAEGVEKSFSLNANLTDETYVETMGMEMVKGRYFSKDFVADTCKIVLNETAVNLLEMEDPIGKITYLWNDRSLPYEVIGVVKDYHWESKHMEVRPHALILLAERFRNPYYLSVRIAGSDYQKIIKTLEEGWDKYVPAIPFEYEILDKHYDGIYKNEKQTRSLLTIFSVLAIFISCLGLFGLASFMAERRTKEIGIRKTNGATTANILRLLSLDFTKWVLLANIIAWPMTWFAMKNWLESFAYRTEIPIWIFIVSGIVAFLIAMATVSFHALRASRQNPVMSLRYE